MTEYLEIAIRITGLILFSIPSIAIIRDSYRQQKEAEEWVKQRRQRKHS
jgi:hypothetical protein